MANDREVKYRITGDVSDLSAALNSAESDFEDLGKAGKSITILENAVASVRAFETEVVVAEQKVRTLKATLSEAYASGAEAPQLKSLERELGSAEKAASRTQASLNKATAEVVRLNLESGKTGVSTANLAARKEQLAVEAEKVQAKMAALANSVKQAAMAEDFAAAQAGRLNAAFSTLNMRSAETINADIQKINQSLGVLARSAGVSGAEFDRAYAGAQQQIAKLKAELNGMNESAGASTGIMGRLTGVFGGLQGILATLGLGAVAEKFLGANVAAEKLERGLTAITGSSQKAAEETKFLRDVATRLGLDFGAASDGFVKFAAATKGTTLEGQKTRDVFESVAGAMSKLGLTAVDQERAFNALGQMMSKGTVTAEELKGQLGDVLPGAFQIAAKSVGVTTAELGKMMEQGGLIADTFLPRFAAELKKSFGETTQVDGLTASFNRMKNMWSEIAVEFGNVGVLDVLKAALGGLNAVLMVTVSTIGIVVTGFLGFGRAIGVVTAAIANMDFSILRDGLAEIGGEMDKSLEHFAKLSNQALGLEEATKKVGQAHADAAAVVAAAGPSFEKLQIIYGELEAKAKASSDTSEKAAEARKAEGAAAVAAAQAFGTEKEQRDALEISTQANANAVAEVTKNRQFELGVVVAHLAQVQQEIATTGQATEAQQKLVDALKQKVAEKQAAADKSVAEAAATKLAADAAAIATQTYNDNSAALETLRAAAAAASAEVANLRAQKLAGVDVAVQLADAEREEAKAKTLYRDAISDQIAKINALNAAKQGEINVAAAGIKLAIEQQRSIIEVARARGDEYAVMQATLEIKKLEIKMAELTAKAKKAEAEAALLLVKAKREELEASGQLTPAKEAELKAQEAAAEVKKIEGDIAQETARRLTELADVTRQSSTAANDAAARYDGLAKSLEGVSNSAKSASDSMSSVNSSGPTGGGGGGSGGGGEKDRVAYSSDIGLMNRIYSRGLDIELSKSALEMAKQFYTQEMSKIFAGGVTGERDLYNKLRFAENQAVEKGIIAAESKAAQDATEKAKGFTAQDSTQMPDLNKPDFKIAQTPTTDQQPKPEQAAQTTIVRIDLGGKKSAINVASKQDADILTGIFKQIEADAQRTF